MDEFTFSILLNQIKHSPAELEADYLEETMQDLEASQLYRIHHYLTNTSGSVAASKDRVTLMKKIWRYL